jgi:hypothetical protein
MVTVKTGFSGITYTAGESLLPDNEIWWLESDATIAKGVFVELVTAGHFKLAGATPAAHVGISLKSSADGDVVPILVKGTGTVTTDATGTAIGDYVFPTAAGLADVATLGTTAVVGLCKNASGASGIAVVELMTVTTKESTT